VKGSVKGRFEFLIDTHRRVKNSGKFNFESCKIPLVTALNIPSWKYWLQISGRKDVNLVQFLEFGWPVGYAARSLPKGALSNHSGATVFSRETEAYISNEVELGAILGPFDSNPLSSQLTISPINSIPKRGSDSRRFIADLSFPKGASVNDGINLENYLGSDETISYPTVDDYIGMIERHGSGCLLYKKDLRRAYRQFPIDPGDIALQGFKWCEKFYIDCALIMGCKSSAMMCQRASSAVTQFMLFNNINVCSYLDDFAGVSRPESALEDFESLGRMLSSLGLVEALNKSVAPSTRMVFLGVTFDTVKMTIEVTPERVLEILGLLESWKFKKSASKREIQSLIGTLQFASKCVPSGRLFVSRILDLLRGLKLPLHRKRITGEFRKDISWWANFMTTFNGVAIMLDQQWTNVDSVVSTEACLTGAGGWVEGEFFCTTFPTWVLEAGWHINALELLTLLVALRLWCPRFKGKRIKVFCDNEASVIVLNSGRCRDSVMLSLLREIAYLCAVHDCLVRAVHLAGVDNRLADKLSRRHTLSDDNMKSLNTELDLKGWSEQRVQDDMFSCKEVW